MALLLTALGAIAACVLLVSAIELIGRVTPTDPSSRGSWGILDWQSVRTRPLDAHERRWQTALLSADRQPERWPDFLEELARLERAAEIPSDPNPPAEFDLEWVRNQINRLDAASRPN